LLPFSSVQPRDAQQPTFLTGDELAFVVGNKTSFELPLQYVANSNIAGRTEVSLEFIAPSDSAGKKPAKGQPDEMVEIRFFVPGQSTRVRGSDAGSNKSDAEDDVDDVSAAQAFHDAIKEKAELGHVSGDIILSFEEVLVLTPRGRYDVDMFPEFLRLRGKTYDYKIVYSSISRLFLLPKDDLHILFIVRSVQCLRPSFLADVCSQAWPQYPHPTRSDTLPVPRHAIQS
jgi:structure-specific recognition protein 1